MLWNTKLIIYVEDLNIIVDKGALNLTDDMTVCGIKIDSQLNFNSHASNMCNKAVRHLNVLQRPKNSLDYASRLSIYDSFIVSNKCIMLWVFSFKSSSSKLEDIKKGALGFVLADYASDCCELLNKADVAGVNIMALRYLATGVYKYINGHNPKYLHDLFINKKIKYVLQDDSVIKWSKVKKICIHGLKPKTIVEAKIWNMLPDSC